MKSGSAPQTTRSSTTIPTRSKPMVSCTPSAWAIATLVPTPSVEVASTGWSMPFRALASNRPAKPPRPLSTSGRRVLATQAFIRSTARSPASMSTPAAAYALCPVPGVHEGRPPCWVGVMSGPRLRPAEGVGRADPGDDDLEPVDVPAARGLLGRLVGRAVLEDALAEPLRERQLDGVDPVEAGPAELVLATVGRRDEAVQADVAERVGADRAADLLDVQPGRDQLGPGGEVDAVEARPFARRRGDRDVYRGRTRLAEHPDQGALGVAAHDRVVDHHQAL